MWVYKCGIRESRCCHLFVFSQPEFSAFCMHCCCCLRFFARPCCIRCRAARAAEAQEMVRKWFYIMDYCFFFRARSLTRFLPTFSICFHAYGCGSGYFHCHTIPATHSTRFSIDRMCWKLHMRYANLNRLNQAISMHNIVRCIRHRLLSHHIKPAAAAHNNEQCGRAQQHWDIISNR